MTRKEGNAGHCLHAAASVHASALASARLRSLLDPGVLAAEQEGHCLYLPRFPGTGNAFFCWAGHVLRGGDESAAQNARFGARVI